MIGTNPEAVADIDDSHFRKFDVRSLDFPEGFEGFDRIVSQDGFPITYLKHLDRNKQGDMGHNSGEYDFEKPIDAPMSPQETTAHIQKGLSEMLRWLKPEGEIRVSPGATWDNEKEAFADYDIVEQALENLRSEYPNLVYEEYIGKLVVIKEPRKE